MLVPLEETLVHVSDLDECFVARQIFIRLLENSVNKLILHMISLTLR